DSSPPPTSVSAERLILHYSPQIGPRQPPARQYNPKRGTKMHTPLYTADNCKPAYQLDWSYALFWRSPPANLNWFADLQPLCEADRVRLLQHEFKPPNVSQFLVSTQPHVTPRLIAQRVKGRLQHLIKSELPKAFRRNYCLRSIGSTRR